MRELLRPFLRCRVLQRGQALISRVFFLTGLAVTFTLSATPDLWALTSSPSGVSFQAVQGAANPPSQTVTVSKSDKHQSKWTVKENATWLSVSPASGSMTSTAQFAIAVNASGLSPGTYKATVKISAGKAGSTSVPVTLTVTAPKTSTGGTASNTSASLSWNPSTSTNVTGYKLYMGTASGVYSTSFNVGNATSYSVNNLAVGTTYYFVVTAYNGSGVESLPSNEASKSIY
ncbi:MAG TPA: fibronectin type III domain-containing protein [Nitrospira sp.]|nr:fibronectin type III domain-containing protein [Nitrospira sp.]